MGTVKTTTKVWTEIINERDTLKSNLETAIDTLLKLKTRATESPCHTDFELIRIIDSTITKIGRDE